MAGLRDQSLAQGRSLRRPAQQGNDQPRGVNNKSHVRSPRSAPLGGDVTQDRCLRRSRTTKPFKDILDLLDGLILGGAPG